VSPEELARFIDYLGDKRAPVTVLHYITCIGTIYRLSERPTVDKSPPVTLAIKRLFRAKGRWQKQAIPLTRDILETLLPACDDSNSGLRDRVLLRLGYDTMRRAAELCSFRFEDMELHPSGRAALHLRFSKTDQMGDGKLIPIGAAAQFSYRTLAPEAIQDYADLLFGGEFTPGVAADILDPLFSV